MSRSSFHSDHLESIFKQNTKNFEYFLLNKEVVVAYKHPFYGKWSSSDEEEFRKVDFVKFDKYELGIFTDADFG